MSDRTLAALLGHLGPHALHSAAPGAPLAQVTQDSRQVVRGGLFVAVPGFRVDGHAFLEMAVMAGALSVVVQSNHRAQWESFVTRPDLTVVEVSDTRMALPRLAAAFHDFPARKLTIVGVTGTDGKSTTCYLTTSMLEAAGHPTGMIGGVQFKVGDDWRMNTITQTSPEADLVQSLLAEMVDVGETHAVIESTSHGLALHRLDDCEYDVAVFTGLSDDHLDFHRTREAYLDAKLELFRMLDRTATDGIAKRGVVRAVDPQRAAVEGATAAPFVHVGISGEADGLDVSVSDVVEEASGTGLRVVTPGGALAARLSLPGRFNVHNTVLAAGAAWALGAGPGAIADGITGLRAVPGRMELIDEGQPFTVIVDAAATTDAFQAVLESVRPLVQKRLIVVFGCAGDRDPGRRTGMGWVAAAYVDYAILTSENPRSEDPAAIVRTIAQPMEAAGRQAGRDFEEEPDRRQAIERAFALAEAGDFVLIAGKGAEQTLITGDHVELWDDRTLARELLAARQC